MIHVREYLFISCFIHLLGRHGPAADSARWLAAFGASSSAGLAIRFEHQVKKRAAYNRRIVQKFYRIYEGYGRLVTKSTIFRYGVTSITIFFNLVAKANMKWE